MKKSILFLFLLSAIVVFQSCEEGLIKEENPDNLVVPELPPAEMFTMPVNDLKDMEKNIQGSQPRDETYFNWLHAGLSVWGWNVIVYINLAVPVAAIREAFNHHAQYIGNNTFEWTYTYQAPANVGGQTYNISLTAEYINTSEIEWKMTASEAGGFTDFLWLSAIIANDQSYATYTLNRNPENPQSYIGILYEKDFPAQDMRLRFTNIIPADPANGHYIEYRVIPNADYNRAFDLEAGPGNLLNVEWDEPSNIGRVKHPQYFNDDEWHCWDTNLIDVDC